MRAWETSGLEVVAATSSCPVREHRCVEIYGQRIPLQRQMFYLERRRRRFGNRLRLRLRFRLLSDRMKQVGGAGHSLGSGPHGGRSERVVCDMRRRVVVVVVVVSER